MTELLLDLILKTVAEVIDRETALPLISTGGVKHDGCGGGRDGSLATFRNMNYNDGCSPLERFAQRYISISFITVIYLVNGAAVNVEATTMAHLDVPQ